MKRSAPSVPCEAIRTRSPSWKFCGDGGRELCESDDDGFGRSSCRLSGRPAVEGASEDRLAAAPRAVGVDGYAAVLLELAFALRRIEG